MYTGNCQAVFKNKKDFLKKRAAPPESAQKASAEPENRRQRRPAARAMATGRITKRAGDEICKTPKIWKNGEDT
jgi:hypothetical protein